MIKMNKKGASVDNFFVVVSMFGLAIFLLTMIVFWNALSSEATDLWTGSSIGGDIQDDAQSAVNNFDFIFAIVYIGFHLGILVTAYLLRTFPVIYVVSIILIAVLVMLSAPLSNAYEDIIAESSLSVASNSLPITNYIMSQLPMFEVIWGFLTAIVMFGFAKGEGYL